MPSSTDYLPARDADLNNWALNFNTMLAAGGPGGIYGLSSAQITAFAALFSTWTTAYNASQAGPTRGPAATQTKNDARAAMVNGPGGIRELVAIIQANPATTDTQRQELLITIRDTEPTPIPVPSLAPQIDLKPPVMRTLTMRLHNEASLGHKGKPQGVDGAIVFAHVGPMPPAPQDIHLWTFQTNTKKTTVEIEFPSSVAPGSVVWVTAFWYNPRGESGPPAPAVYTVLPGTMTMAA